MSISSRITEMEQHIGNAYDKIEDLGIDLTDVDKNIDNISSMLENVWKEYPKVPASDVEEASLNGTKKGRINIDLKGNTEQEQLTGKNLFDKDNANVLNNIFISGGSVLKSGNNNITIYIPCKGNTTYTIQKIADNVFRAGTTQTIPSENITVDDYNNNPTGTNITLTTSANAKYIVVFIKNAESKKSLTELYNTLQIEEGSTATSYEPYCGRNT